MDAEGLLAEPLDSHLLRLGAEEEVESSAVSFEPFPSVSLSVSLEEGQHEPKEEQPSTEEDVVMGGNDDEESDGVDESMGDDKDFEETVQVYCGCRRPDDGKFMISCDKCQEW